MLRSNSTRMLLVVLFATLILPGVALASKKGKKKKKGKAEEPPPVGWYAEPGWLGECWSPPNFSELASGPRRMAWQQTRDALMEQWQGQKGDGVKFGNIVIENLETALLARPERIEQVAAENLTHCKNAMAGKGAGEWEKWINALPAKLTEGECRTRPLDYTLFDYLSVNADWHVQVPVCKDDHVRIQASAGDFYRLTEKGPWINVEGDKSEPASGNLPCTIEGCYRGTLVMRFTGESGTQTILPVGVTRDFRAPEHGRIDVMINDDSLHDNIWKTERGIVHHASIEYSPVP